jgi:ABC-type multidrug transport system ATPase subunit
MKQRLGIAAALLNDPKLLLLDEPSNGLDPAGIVAMRDTLRNLADAGKTVFVSSHLLGEVQQMVDVIGIISAGRLVREGPIEDLLSGGGIVRVRVERNDVERSIGVLAGIAGPDGATASTAEPGWISVRTTADRISEGQPGSRRRRYLGQRPGVRTWSSCSWS